MLDLDRRFLLELSHAALQAIIEKTSDVKWKRYDSLTPYRSVSLSAQHPGLKLRSRVAGSDNISRRHLEWTPDCGCNVALDIHRQQCCSVPLACKDEDTLLRKRQQDDFEECMKTNTNKLEEARLEKSLLDEPPVELLGFPYLCARDYDSAGGKGDLVFTDGQGLYAVIEVKHINKQGSNVTKKRRTVKAQARKYGQAFRADDAATVVVVAAYYTEESDRLQWIALDGQDSSGVQQFIAAVAAAAAEVTSGVTNANEPIMSDESKQHLAMGAGIVGVGLIGLELYLDRKERQDAVVRDKKTWNLCFLLSVLSSHHFAVCGCPFSIP